MYLRKQEAQELHDEADQPIEEGLQKSSGVIVCQPALTSAKVNSGPIWGKYPGVGHFIKAESLP